MANYYFLAPSLPPLKLGEIPEITFVEFLNRLETNLTEKDFHQSQVLRRYIDLENVHAFLMQQPLDSRGNLSVQELDEALLHQVDLPTYVFDFLSEHETAESRARAFPELLISFFREETAKAKGFLHRYLEFEREWRIVLTAIRAKQLGRDLVQEMQFEDFSDPLVAHVLAQRDVSDYEPPSEYTDLKEGIIAAGEDAEKRYYFLAEYRYRKVKELVQSPLFSIDWILGYTVRLMIVEDWIALDRKKGEETLEQYLPAKAVGQ